VDGAIVVIAMTAGISVEHSACDIRKPTLQNMLLMEGLDEVFNKTE